MKRKPQPSRLSSACRPLLVLPLLVFALAGFSVSGRAQQQVSVQQLEQVVAKKHATSDKRAAQEIARLHLTERLSGKRLARIDVALPGEESRLALLAVADASAFLNLPAADLPSLPAPDGSTQSSWIAKTADYLRTAMPRLPDFTATQLVLHFSDGPLKDADPGPGKPWDPRLHLASQSSGNVRFIAGKEEVQPQSQSGSQPHTTSPKPMTVEGVFGPIITIALDDILASNPTWSHWEQGDGGPVAVLAYTVPLKNSRYEVPVPGGFDPGPARRSYHGEMAIDPSTGAILRLTVQATEEPDSPVSRADILVEYGPVAMAGKSWVCPLHSVAVGQVRKVDLMHDLYKFSSRGPLQYELELNDVSYNNYHLFGSVLRVMPAGGPQASPAPGQPHPNAPK